MHSLISESPFISDEESDEIQLNQIKMVEHGRSDEVKLTRAGLPLSLSQVRKEFHEELTLLAAAMDTYSSGYSEALQQETGRKESLSQKIMNEMKEKHMTFQEYGLSQSKKIAANFTQNSKEDLSLFVEAAQVSRKELKILEETSSVNLSLIHI